MRFVLYFRTSTKKQSLGIEAQRAACAYYLASVPGSEVVAEFEEKESAKTADRAQLLKAIARAKAEKAVLLCSKLDRLSRQVSYISWLMDQTDIDFRIAENPTASRFNLHILAAMAEEERRLISERTRAALATIKSGVRTTKKGATTLGSGMPENGAICSAHVRMDAADDFAERVAPQIEIIRRSGAKTYRAIAAQLNALGIRSARGGLWQPTSVRNAMLRQSAS